MDNANKHNRLSLPGKILNLLLSDDTFYREVAASKKVSLPNFPKHDQWLGQDGFCMEFALAGYSYKDILIRCSGYTLSIENNKKSLNVNSSSVIGSGDEYIKDARPKIQQGVIVRGIARRSFRSDFFISPLFDLKKATACMRNGLLKVSIPFAEENESVIIDVAE